MADVIVVLIIVICLLGSVGYMIRNKRRGGSSCGCGCGGCCGNGGCGKRE